MRIGRGAVEHQHGVAARVGGNRRGVEVPAAALDKSLLTDSNGHRVDLGSGKAGQLPKAGFSINRLPVGTICAWLGRRLC